MIDVDQRCDVINRHGDVIGGDGRECAGVCERGVGLDDGQVLAYVAHAVEALEAPDRDGAVARRLAQRALQRLLGG